uniref:Uncharacterized protein n=1 Tax=Megaselia scalaris TaxID=36166 RepID=T1H1F7_MEGSC
MLFCTQSYESSCVVNLYRLIDISQSEEEPWIREQLIPELDDDVFNIFYKVVIGCNNSSNTLVSAYLPHDKDAPTNQLSIRVVEGNNSTNERIDFIGFRCNLVKESRGSITSGKLVSFKLSTDLIENETTIIANAFNYAKLKSYNKIIEFYNILQTTNNSFHKNIH